MERKPHSTGSIVGAVVLLVVVLLGLYFGGYFVLGEYDASTVVRTRMYPYDWLAYGYRPVANLEAAITRDLVWVMGPGQAYISDIDLRELEP